MSTLYQTYEANTAMAGKTDEANPLSVVAHITANAQIELTVKLNGTFGGAMMIEKGNGKTLIPVTEASAARTVGFSPHSLCDTLSYVAGDYCEYTDDKKSEEKFQLYSDALKKWTESEYTDEKIQAIYKYISGKTMISDLVESDLGSVDTNTKMMYNIRYENNRSAI